MHYEIGGSWDLSNIYKTLYLKTVCTKSCGTDGNCGTLAIYQIGSVINPESK